MAGNHPSRGLRFEQDEASALSGNDHGRCTNDSADIAQADVPRKFHLKDANKFAKTLKNADEVFVGFLKAINVSGKCYFTHRTAYGDVLETVVKRESKALLDEMQTCFPNIFKEPKYPMIQNRVPFSIFLVNEKFPPPKRKLYPLSKPELKELREQLKVLVDSGRIVPSASLYGAPILFPDKKGGSGLRICTDYCNLNSNMVTNSFPVPRIDELQARLRGSKVFSKLDLCDSYHQIPIAQEYCHKTVFNGRYDAFEFRVVQFGLKNVPAPFQRTIN